MIGNAYLELEKRFHQAGLLRSISGTLSWDAATIMPAGARQVRGAQLGTLEALTAEAINGNDMPDLLAEAETDQACLNDWQKANLREMRREYFHASAVPNNLLVALTEAQTRCEGIWIDAKPQNDFQAVAASAHEVLELKREVAQCKGDKLDCLPHDALVDQWDPGLKAADLVPIFSEVANKLPALIDRALAHQAAPLRPIPHIPRSDQLALCEELADLLGYDRAHGYIAESAQACFMDDCPEDVRITVDVDETDYRSAAIGITHEIGHSFYERAMPGPMRYQPVARPASAGFQESQSLLFEKIVMRTNVFAERLSSFIAKNSPHITPTLSAAAIGSHIRFIDRGLIRCEADEATYPLHVIIRYRLEKAMIEDGLSFHDLPEAWAEAYETVLGIRPDNNREGCLQDIHWYRGLYGYFQSYALGSLISAQVFEAALHAKPEIQRELDKGDVSGLRTWLTQVLYSKARLLPPNELMKAVTGQTLNPNAFLRHIQQRYVPVVEELTV